MMRECGNYSVTGLVITIYKFNFSLVTLNTN